MGELDPFDRDRISREVDLLSDLRALGAVELEKPRRTMGFEKRLERADKRPRTAAAWGHVPDDR